MIPNYLKFIFVSQNYYMCINFYQHFQLPDVMIIKELDTNVQSGLYPLVSKLMACFHHLEQVR